MNDANLNHLRTFREEARTKRAILDDRIFKYEKLQQDINQVEDDLKPLEKRYNEILYIEENLSSLRDTLLSSQGNLKSITLAIKELKLVIKLEFDGDDSDLEKALNNFNTNLL